MRFVIKPVFWNANEYTKPSGFRAQAGWPKENGYGHEEWNNAPFMTYTDNGLLYKVFHTEYIWKDVKNYKDIILFQVASHDGVQELVSVSGLPISLHFDDEKRLEIANTLNSKQMSSDAWSVVQVKEAENNRRSYEKFEKIWNKNFHWIPNWLCLNSQFFVPSPGCLLDLDSVFGGRRTISRYSTFQSITQKQAQKIMGSIPESQRNSAYDCVLSMINGNYIESSNDFTSLLEADLDAIIYSKSLSETDKKTLVLSRIGQGLFRNQVLDLNGARCAVTGCCQPEVIIASHIKPWCKSNNEERLDPKNGLPLSANLDRLFDSGLISFDNKGYIILSSKIKKRQLEIIGISKGARLLKSLDVRQLEYMKYHRDNIFRK